jgi:resuscitation-promoting factor RpfB
VSFRYYKRIRLGKGINLNFSKTGVGISAGVPGARYSMHSSGRRVKTVGIPGTGLYYRKDTYTTKPGARVPPSAPALQVRSRPSPFMPRRDKAFVGAARSVASGDWADALAELSGARRAKGGSAPSIEFLTAACYVGLGQRAQAIEPLERVVASDQRLPDDLMRRYLAASAVQVQVTPNVIAQVAMDRAGAALLLAEVLQHTGRTPEAIELLETLGASTSSPALALSLADLYVEQGAWEDARRVTQSFVANTDDLSLQILALRARAQRESGDLAGAAASLKEALRFRKRDPHLLNAARYERALLEELMGRRAQARKDLTRIYDADPAFEDVAERLGRPEPPPPAVPADVDGPSGTAALLPPPAPTGTRGTTSALSGWIKRHKALTAVITCLLALFLIGTALGRTDHTSAVASASLSSSTSPQAQASPAATSAPSTPPPAMVKVPTLVGRTLGKAKRAATKARLEVALTKRYAHAPAGTILRQSIAGGHEVEEHTILTLVVAKPYPHVPGVIGKQHSPAARLLKKAGYQVKLVQQPTTTVTDGVVLSESPSPTSELLPGHVVTLVVANNTCTPGYSPCLPYASDYDCAGGSGDGPKYVYGVETVTGSDIYGLDADNDGLGCE